MTVLCDYYHIEYSCMLYCGQHFVTWDFVFCFRHCVWIFRLQTTVRCWLK